jgi:GNAT superfamily N-acetyltransferase
MCLGFASFQHDYLDDKVTRLHKIYLLPDAQGKGVGRLLIDAVVGYAEENNSKVLSLNVNRFNKAVTFYQKLGFEIVGKEDIELDHGYLMEDYKLEKKI